MKATNSTTNVAAYREAYQALASTRSSEPDWLLAARERAAGAFERLGFPTTRDEDWRFTNVSPIAEARFERADDSVVIDAGAVEPYLVPGVAGAVLVFVDGRYNASLSRPGRLPEGSFAGNLEGALQSLPEMQRHLAGHAAFDQRSFTSLNTALFEDAAVLRIPDNAVVEEPIQLVFLSSGRSQTASFPRALVWAGENSQLRVIETYASLGTGKALTNAVTEVVAGPAAVVDHYRLQREAREAFHVGLTQLRLDRSASVSSHVVSLGGRISRHDAVAVLAAEGADCTLNGVYIADGQRLVDNHTDVDHAMPNGTSHELYKGILSERAHAVFNGRIRVRPDAQKTDAKQTNKSLLLSDEAQINTKPQLEILANDVKCTHGATVGQLSAEALFYLQARGIGREDARSMLVRAFAGEVLNRMKLESVRELVDRLILELLPGTSERTIAA